LQISLNNALNEQLFFYPVAYEVGNRDYPEFVFLGKHFQFRHSSHRAIVIHYLADHRCRLEPGDPSDVNARLSLPDPYKNAAAFCPKRKDVARASKVGRPCCRIYRCADGPGPVRGRDPGRHAFTSLDRYGESGAHRGSIRCCLGKKLKLVTTLFCKRQTYEAAAVNSHEIYHFRRHQFGRADQVSLVLAILIVDDNDHLAIPYIAGGFFDSC